MRRLEIYVKKYGPEAGPKLYHLLQSQAAHAGVSARLRRKIEVLTGKRPAPAPVVFEAPAEPAMPLFDGLAGPDGDEAGIHAGCEAVAAGV